MNVFVICLIIVAVLAALYLFLVCPRIFRKPDYSHLYGVHYAHRGLFDNDSDAPENSMAAIKKAVDADYGIEFDVRLTKDGIPVVFHDDSLERMCGIQKNVWEYTLKELQQIKLAKSNETIPTFEDVLKVVNGQVPLIIEYKIPFTDVEVCEKANALLESYKGPYCIESFQPLAVQWYKNNRPDVVRGQLSMEFFRTKERRKDFLYWCLSMLLVNVMGRPDFIAYNHFHANNMSRRICKMLGALSVAWTIRSQEEFEQAKDKFDLFIFDSCRL